MEVLDVNEVYQTVLAILNKEQRGYITPYEFNLLATQVQLEIFESYFSSLNLQLQKPGNDNEYADKVKLLRQKISRFETEKEITITITAGKGEGDLATLTPNLYKLGSVYYTKGDLLPVEAEQVDRQTFNLLRRAAFTSPTADFPVYYKEENKIKILPAIASAAAANPPGTPAEIFTVDYIKKPADVVWGYTIGAVGQYLYNAGTSTQFEISPSEQAEVILKILAYSGVVVRDPEIIQTAGAGAASIDQQQMQ